MENNKMTFKEFSKWCNLRWHDSCWGMIESLTCINIGSEIQKMHFWKREKEWQKKNEEYKIVESIVIPINKLIEERNIKGE